MPVAADKVNKLLHFSRQVLLDCCLANGAVIAANTDASYYPKQANDYRYVWPRDAAFILYALELLGESHTEQFAGWLLERAEQFTDTGLFCRRYATNGAASYPHNQLQPDQSGALLWAFCAKDNVAGSPAVQQTVQIIADNLAKDWNGHGFSRQTYDLWEHHSLSPETGVFTYTLASCSYGLQQAHRQHPQPNSGWLATASSMQTVLEQESGDTYKATTGTNDQRLDASLYGLSWPFAVTPNRDKLMQTLVAVHEQLEGSSGIIRFPGDTYDGEVADSVDLNNGGGSWPLLSLWEVLAWQALDQPERAQAYFAACLEKLPQDYLPEQLFEDERVGVKPLGWAHAMFVITCAVLGFDLPGKPRTAN